MGEEIKKDTRQLIRDQISIQRHKRVKEEFQKRLQAIEKRYENYPNSQRPRMESLIDIICGEIAFTYSLRKVTVSKIVQDYYRYEEADTKA